MKLSDGKRLPSIMDIRNAKTISRDARVYYTGVENNKVVLACAMLVDNSFSKIIGNFLLA